MMIKSHYSRALTALAILATELIVALDR